MNRPADPTDPTEPSTDPTADLRLLTMIRSELHAHAGDLDVPAAPTSSVLDRGRGLRRRQRVVTAVAAVAATVVLGGSILLSLPHSGRDSAPDPVGPPGDAPVFAVGSHVYLDGTSVEVPSTVHSLHFTSAGVLVRSNAHDGSSDGSGDETLTLVDGTGREVDLGTVPEGYGPATDPALPYYALAEEHDGRLFAVLREVADGSEAHRVPLPDLDSGGWDVPPLALSGDVLYATYADTTYAVDWRTGAEVPLAFDDGSVKAGRVVTSVEGRPAVLDARTGETLLAVTPPKGAYGWLELSPDGAYAMLFIEEYRDGRDITSSTVYDVRTGAHVTVPGAPWDLGWTLDGHLYRIDGDVVTTCSPVTGACTEESVTVERAPEPTPVEKTETTCDKHGRNCGTMTWTETPEEPANKVTLAGRSYES